MVSAAAHHPFLASSPQYQAASCNPRSSHRLSRPLHQARGRFRSQRSRPFRRRRHRRNRRSPALRWKPVQKSGQRPHALPPLPQPLLGARLPSRHRHHRCQHQCPSERRPIPKSGQPPPLPSQPPPLLQPLPLQLPTAPPLPPLPPLPSRLPPRLWLRPNCQPRPYSRCLHARRSRRRSMSPRR